MAEIKKISTELQLLDKFLDTGGSAGSSGNVLTSTSTGTSWVSAGTPGAGVYLPLAGGTLTGALAGTSASFTGALSSVGYSGTSGTFSASVTASGNSNNFGNTIIAALTATSGTFSASVTAAGNSNIFGATTVTSNLTTNGVFTIQNAAPYIQWKNVAGTRLSYIQHNATNLVVSADTGQIQLDTAADNDILINPGGTGNVGIGTTSPGYKLQVNGTIAPEGNEVNNLGSSTNRFNQLWTKLIYDINDGRGLTNQILTSTGSGGIAWANASTVIGGPYLPLSAGSSYPLTDNLFIRGDDKGLVVQNAASTTNVTVGAVSSSAVSTGLITLRHLGATKILLNANDNSYFAGNIGIKTTSPVNPLGINFAPNGIGSITTSNNSTAWNTSSAIMLEGASNSNGLGFGVSGTANDRKSWIQSGHPDQQYASSLGTLAINPLGGNVGIGTISPASKLVVEGAGEQWISVFTTDITGAGAENGYRTQTSTGSRQNTLYRHTANNLVTLRAGTDDGAINFIAGGSAAERMRILANGNIGIGTTSPAQDFVVADATLGNGIELVPGATATIQTYNRGSSSYNNLNLDVARLLVRSFDYTTINTGSALTERMRWLADGQFWIKLNSTTSGREAAMSNDEDKLIIFGSRHGGTGKYVSIWSDGANENARFYPTNTVFYKNVGINTTTPSKKLEVNGSFKLGTNAYIEYGGVYPYTISTLNTAAVGNLIFTAGSGSSGYESGIELQGSNTAGAAGITLSTGSSPRIVVTADGEVIVNDNLVNYEFTALDNVSVQYWLLCLNAGANDVNGTLIGDRSSGHHQAMNLDIVVSAKSASMQTGMLTTKQVLEANEKYTLVTLTYNSTSYVAIKYDGHPYPITNHGYFTGLLKSTIGSDFLLAVNGASVSAVAAFSNANTKATIQANKVGIGTADPAYNFEVNGYAKVGTLGINAAPDAYLSSLGARLAIGGNIVINTASPLLYLRANGGTTISDIRYQNSLRLTNGAGNTHLTILNSGNVGINRTSPAEKFEVGGDSAFYGAIKGYTGSSSNQYLSILQSVQGNTYISTGTSGETINFSTGSTQNVTNINVAGTATATNFILSSDETLKDNVKKIDTKHIDVEWKSFELKSEPGVKRSGVIAQELEKKNPEFVRTDDKGLKSVAYIDLLISKIAELEARLEKAGI